MMTRTLGFITSVLFSFILPVLVISCSCGDDDDDSGGAGDDSADDSSDDAVDDAADDSADDSATDDTADDTSDDTVDDDADFGFVVLTLLLDSGLKVGRVDAPMGDITVLTDITDHINDRATITPDGSTIFFASNMHDPDPGINFATMLYKMPAAGGTAERVTDEDWTMATETWPAVSPDGTTVAYIRSHSVELPSYVDRIWFAPTDGEGRWALYPDDVESRNDWAPAFSPDGQTLVYLSDGDSVCGDVYVADLSSEPYSRVRMTTLDCMTSDGASDPFFDASGDWIYFGSTRDDSYGLYKIPATGGDPLLVWDIGISTNDDTLGMPNYSDLRPSSDWTGLAGYGAATGWMQTTVFPGIDPHGEPTAVTDAGINTAEPYWWKPAAPTRRR